MSATLRRQLQSNAHRPTVIAAALQQYAPQLLQLEQQHETAASTEEETAHLYEWVRAYTHQHEHAPIGGAPEADESLGSAPAASAASSTIGPAPLFFYLLHGGCAHICLSFLSALYTDAASDQSYYWLNDPLAFLTQLQTKYTRTVEERANTAAKYARTRAIGQWRRGVRRIRSRVCA
jgi:hypothetical protein